MKISNLTPLSQVPKPEQSNSSDKTTANAGLKSGQAAAVAHLSQAAQDSSQDVDFVRVDELRQAISEGRLEINSEKIADGLIANVRNLLDQN